MNDFIKQQQELTRDEFLKWDKDATKLKCKPDDLIFFADTLITQIITKTGEELMRFVDETPDVKENGLVSRDTLKQHITSVTGVE